MKHSRLFRLSFVTALLSLLLTVGIYTAYINDPASKKGNMGGSNIQSNKESFIHRVVNAKYTVDPENPYFFKDGIFYFENGGCKGKCTSLGFSPDSNYAVVILKDKIATGDLNGDGRDDAMVILKERHGGTGYDITLGVLLQDEKGDPIFTASKELGHYVMVESIGIKDGLIELAFSVGNPEDPFCCTQTINHSYKLEGEKIVERK